MFCQKSTFLAAIRTVKEAYSEASFAGRGIDGMRYEILRDIGPFFNFMEEWAEGLGESINYGSAFDSLVVNDALSRHAGHIAKHLELIQFTKPGSPAQMEVRNSIKTNLEKSGHAAMWKELAASEQNTYVKEVVTATILYHLLALHGSLSMGGKGNPIYTLRRSMRDRLPEEYFSSLVAGWIAEDRFIKAVGSAGASVMLVAGDRNLRIKLKSERRGKSITTDAGADFIVSVPSDMPSACQ